MEGERTGAVSHSQAPPPLSSPRTPPPRLWQVLVDTLNVLAPLERTEGTPTTVLISMERRNEDGVPQFLEKLRLTFDVEVEWASFDDADLAALLTASHISEERKPLQLLRAVRRRG